MWMSCGLIAMWRLDDLRGANNYLDTNVLIYAFEGDEADNRRRRVGALFRDLAEGRAQASASVITRTEGLARSLREGDLPLVNWYRELLSGRGLVEVLAVNQAIADLAAELRAEQRSLRVPDALHLATAIHNGCASFVTADEKLTIAAHRIRVLLLAELEKGV